MHLAPGCTLGTRGPLCDSVALPGTLAGLAVLTVGVHAVGSCPPSCAWGAQGLVCGGSWGRPLSYSWREAGGASHRKPSLMPVPRQRPPSRHVPDRLGSLGSGESSGCAAWLLPPSICLPFYPFFSFILLTGTCGGTTLRNGQRHVLRGMLR